MSFATFQLFSGRFLIAILVFLLDLFFVRAARIWMSLTVFRLWGLLCEMTSHCSVRVSIGSQVKISCCIQAVFGTLRFREFSSQRYVASTLFIRFYNFSKDFNLVFYTMHAFHSSYYLRMG